MKTLFDKTKIRKLALKNRFIRATIHENSPQGYINATILNTYKKLAQGGVGTIIAGFTLVDEAEKTFPPYGPLVGFCYGTFWGRKKLHLPLCY
jgi:2,4-dienoyl-CoA reductase-like NADH-dependent reductase (Old Yellow Enzyme family)